MDYNSHGGRDDGLGIRHRRGNLLGRKISTLSRTADMAQAEADEDQDEPGHQETAAPVENTVRLRRVVVQVHIPDSGPSHTQCPESDVGQGDAGSRRRLVEKPHSKFLYVEVVLRTGNLNQTSGNE